MGWDRFKDTEGDEFFNDEDDNDIACQICGECRSEDGDTCKNCEDWDKE